MDLDLIYKVCLIISTILTSLTKMIDFFSNRYGKSRKEINMCQFTRVLTPLMRIVSKREEISIDSILFFNDEFNKIKEANFASIPVSFIANSFSLNTLIREREKHEDLNSTKESEAIDRINRQIIAKYTLFSNDITYQYNKMAHKLGYPCVSSLTIIDESCNAFRLNLILHFFVYLLKIVPNIFILPSLILLSSEIISSFILGTNQGIHWIYLIYAIGCYLVSQAIDYLKDQI